MHNMHVHVMCICKCLRTFTYCALTGKPLTHLLSGVAVQDVAIAELTLKALREPRGRL